MTRFARMISAVDAHACGEPGRVITGGVLDVPGGSMYEKMTHLRDHADGLRRLMLREPRGYPASNCNLLLPPTLADADAGFVIMEQVEYPAMSGTNTICVVTVLLETGMLPVIEPVTRLVLETPAGLVSVEADVTQGRVERVTFRNVPAFACYLDHALDVPDVGRVVVDVAWGGMFYVLCDATSIGVELEPANAAQIVRVTERIKTAAREQLSVSHPDNPGLNSITIGQLYAPGRSGRRRNVVTVSTGQPDPRRPETFTGAIDRSPCGTGTCAAMAVLHAKGQLAIGEAFEHEGILGTVFTGRLVEETRIGPRAAVVPTLSGQAWITGFAQYVVDPTDPFPEGFTLGDIWGGDASA